MKNLLRALALALVLMLSLSAVFAEDTAPETTVETPADTAPETTVETPADDNPVLVTVNGDAFSKAEVDEVLQMLFDNSYVSSLTDYNTGISYIVQNYIIEKKIAELQMDVFTDEEKAAFAADAQKQWDDAVAEYVAYFLTDDTEEARAELAAAANQYYTGQGITIDMLVEQAASAEAYNRLLASVIGDNDVSATADEITEVFNGEVEYYKNAYQDNIMYYEYNVMYMGGDCWYMPAGYRGVTQILLDVDEALLTDYQNKLAAYEETLSAPAADETAPATDETAPVTDETAPVTDETATPEESAAPAVTLADVEAAREAVLASVKDKTDAIYKKLADGVAFNDLIAEYNTDPGMEDETNLKNGYAVHKDSFVYDTAFVSAAFSEKMTKPGDVSDPTAGQYGVYLLYYLRDIPEGAVERTEEIDKMITDYIVSQKKNKLISAAYDGWQSGYTIEYNEDLIAQLSDATAGEE